MGWWFLPMAFWAIGLIVMIGGHYVGHKIGETRDRLHHHAKSEKFGDTDTETSIYFTIGEKALGMVPWVSVRLFYLIVGMVIFALGFVALSFVI